MKYKVGDRVRIKSIDWYNENKGNADKTNSVWCEDGGAWFYYHMSQYCGKIMTIENVWSHSYTLEGSDSRWTDEMIEGLVDITQDRVDKLACKIDKELSSGNPYEWECPKGYIFKDENGNVINATKIVLEKKKKEYPKTYKECCKVLGIEGNSLLISTKYITDYERGLWNLTGQLHGLIICRDAYWKIAGEEMGLGKPWEPIDNSEICYGIFNWAGKIHHDTTAKWCILTFPTEEMRDAFYENFKELIEQCKELL